MPDEVDDSSGRVQRVVDGQVDGAVPGKDVDGGGGRGPARVGVGGRVGTGSGRGQVCLDLGLRQVGVEEVVAAGGTATARKATRQGFPLEEGEERKLI